MEYKKINMPGLLHGGDYNPEQWLDRPDILEEDIRLMKLAHVNNVSLGIFSWAFLEPEEGKYQFDYLEEIIYVFLTIFLYLLKCPQILIL